MTRPAARALRALVVDPDPQERELFVAALARHGFEVGSEESEGEVAESLGATQTHLLLLAASHARNGLATLLRRDRRASAWPVVVAIADRRLLRTRRPLLREHADQIILRPVSEETVDTWLGLGRRMVEERAAALESLDRLRLHEALLATLPVGITVTDPGGAIILTNPAEAGMHGFTVEELLGRDAHTLAPENMRNPLSSRQIAALPRWRRASVNVRRGGPPFPVELTSVPLAISDHRIGLLTISEDISHRAMNDALTGLPNRASLLAEVQTALTPARRDGAHGFAVLHVDLDHFRNVNYGLGYVTADRLLPMVAERLRSAATAAQRTTALVAYLGADEFAILLRGVREQAEAAQLARVLLERLATPFHVETHDLLLTASIGVAMGDRSYVRAEDILRDADAAMMRAKALGGASYTFFEPELDRRAMAELRLEDALRRALQGNELRLAYQPIVRLDTGRIAGLEALVRWRDRSGNHVAPDEFIPVAERTGLIVTLDRWAVRETCRQIRAWQGQLRRTLPFPVSVNVSGVQFLRPDFVVEVDRELRTHGLYGTSLRFEITESALMTRGRQAADMLRQLLALRIALSIDDFGTGYSSLAYLHELEADTLKIDRSFVSRMHRDPGGLEIVRAIVRLAQNLSKRVVAEGVELRSQVEELSALGCQLAQGHYFFPPQPPEKVGELLAQHLEEGDLSV
jgi:diguanylate cyclase (GGDEF)-like protein/PAS domain S-box-containing protein